jgi:hypothetical protein
MLPNNKLKRLGECRMGTNRNRCIVSAAAVLVLAQGLGAAVFSATAHGQLVGNLPPLAMQSLATAPQAPGSVAGPGGTGGRPSGCSINADANRNNLSAQALRAATNAMVQSMASAGACPMGAGGAGQPGSPQFWQNILSQSDRTIRALLSSSEVQLSCINAGGGCQEPQFDANQSIAGCDMFRGENGMFSERRWREVLSQIASSKCASECRLTNLNNAIERMDCLRRRMQAVKRGMDGFRQAVESNLNCQRDYVASIDREVTRLDQQTQTMEGFQRGPLAQAQARLAALVGPAESQLQGCAQAVQEYQQRQTRFAEAQSVVTTERGAQCFVQGNLEEATGTRCTLGGYDGSNTLDMILCRWEMNLRNRGVVRSDRHPWVDKLRRFRQDVNARLGAGQYYRAGAAGQFSGAESSPVVASGMARSPETFVEQLNNLMSTSGIRESEWLVSQIRNLQQRCFSRAQREVRGMMQPASAGKTPGTLTSASPEVQQIMQGLQRDGNALLGGGTTTMEQRGGGDVGRTSTALATGGNGACGEGGLARRVREFDEALQSASQALYGSSGQFMPQRCSRVTTTTTGGSLRSVNGNINSALSCYQTGVTLANSILNGSAYPGPDGAMRSFPRQRINVQVQPPIECAGLTDCNQAITNRIAQNNALKEQYKGDQTFRTASGQELPGRQRYVREQSQALSDSINAAGAAFTQLSASMHAQQDEINNMIRGLGDSIPELELQQYGREEFNCPREAGADGTQALCEMPRDLNAVVGGRSDPPSFDLERGPAALTQAMTSLRQGRTRFTRDIDRYNQKIREMESQRSACRREDAVIQAQEINAGMDEILANCQAADADRARLCENDVSELDQAMEEIEIYLNGREGARERREYQSRRSRIRTLCNGVRTEGDYTNETNGCRRSSDENQYNAAARRICGANEALTMADAASASDGEQRRTGSITQVVDIRMSGTQRVACLMPCSAELGCHPQAETREPVAQGAAQPGSTTEGGSSTGGGGDRSIASTDGGGGGGGGGGGDSSTGQGISICVATSGGTCTERAHDCRTIGDNAYNCGGRILSRDEDGNFHETSRVPLPEFGDPARDRAMQQAGIIRGRTYGAPCGSGNYYFLHASGQEIVCRAPEDRDGVTVQNGRLVPVRSTRRR